ncbi:hypothetical protein ALC56_09938 [Trachymyrmex septentrionalis]|uniref:Uncharacterized protein n=1 Tax=Trachymyrmex septentrionalis TaxID=34720 RepID=A0A195F5J8_9HYME|nr:hypothetical protein ALC56_09938 [Trachymyrmex septentrionalis]
MKINISLKIHFLHNHLDFFPPNLGEFSEEQDERFHQDIAIIEKRFKGKDIRYMLGEYCWFNVRDTKSESNGKSNNQDSYNNYNYNYIIIIIQKFENI